MTVSGASSSKAITINVSNPATPLPADVDGYVEANGYVAIEAEPFHDRVSRGGAEWRVLTQLGWARPRAIVASPDSSPGPPTTSSPFS